MRHKNSSTVNVRSLYAWVGLKMFNVCIVKIVVRGKHSVKHWHDGDSGEEDDGGECEECVPPFDFVK
jgi:hypothetical protein